MIVKTSQHQNFNEFLSSKSKDKENKSVGKRKKTKQKMDESSQYATENVEDEEADLSPFAKTGYRIREAKRADPIKRGGSDASAERG